MDFFIPLPPVLCKFIDIFKAMAIQGKNIRLQREIKFPSEPSHWILLENPFHKSSRSCK
jgi:hypothetical protein